LDIPLDVALRKNTKGANSEAFLGNNHVFNSNPLLSNIILPNNLWTMGVIPKGGWPTRADNYLPIRVLLFSVGGLLFFLAWFVGKLLEKRKEAEQILARAINAIDGGFVLYGPDGAFVTCNQKYKEIYELSADLFKPGVTFEHIIREGMKRGEYPTITEQKEEWIAWRLERHKMADITDEHRLPNGRWIKVSETKLVDDSRVGIHIDITELVLAKKSAEQANQVKSAFLNTLSHELRTPLTIVLGYARILLNIEALPAAKELQVSIKSTAIDADEIQTKLANVMTQVIQQSEKINESGVHLLTLISDILDFSKADAGEMKFDKQFIPVGKLVGTVIDHFKGLAKEKNLQLSYQLNGETVFADEVRTKQILINLVGNALKFTDAGSVMIKTRQKENEIEFSVIDTGCGIPENKVSAVFTEFYQIDSSDTRKISGTGLGLSIVKKMVELQGGKVGLSSVLGKGSIFNFTLPSVDHK
ncbi:MAG: ATP-binding protein, partial [Amylibacter sp.]